MIKQIVNEILRAIAMLFKSVTYLIKIVYVWFRAFSQVSEHSADEFVKEAKSSDNSSNSNKQVIDLDSL